MVLALLSVFAYFSRIRPVYRTFLLYIILDLNNLLIETVLGRVVIREGPGRTPGVGPSTGSGQQGEVPPRVRVGISRGRPVGPVHRGNDVI